MEPRTRRGLARSGRIKALRSEPEMRLLELMAEGEHLAFAVIVDRYRRELVGYCSRMFPEVDAEAAADTTLLAAYREVRAGHTDADPEVIGRIRPWLKRLAVGVCLEEMDTAISASPPAESPFHEPTAAHPSHGASESLSPVVALTAARTALHARLRAGGRPTPLALALLALPLVAAIVALPMVLRTSVMGPQAAETVKRWIASNPGAVGGSAQRRPRPVPTELRRLFAIAEPTGLTREQVAAGYAVLRQRGGSGRDVGETLQAIIEMLANPTPETRQALTTMGVSVDEVRRSLRERGLVQTLLLLQSRADERRVDLSTIFTDERILQRVRNLIDQHGQRAFDKFLRRVASGASIEAALAELGQGEDRDSGDGSDDEGGSGGDGGDGNGGGGDGNGGGGDGNGGGGDGRSNGGDGDSGQEGGQGQGGQQGGGDQGSGGQGGGQGDRGGASGGSGGDRGGDSGGSGGDRGGDSGGDAGGQ